MAKSTRFPLLGLVFDGIRRSENLRNETLTDLSAECASTITVPQTVAGIADDEIQAAEAEIIGYLTAAQAVMERLGRQ